MRVGLVACVHLQCPSLTARRIYARKPVIVNAVFGEELSAKVAPLSKLKADFTYATVPLVGTLTAGDVICHAMN